MRPLRTTSPTATVAAVLALALAFALLGPLAALAVPQTNLGGANGFETAVAISRASYPATATAVIVASSSGWYDALGGPALAGAAGSPILFSAPAALPSAVAAEIARLRPATVYLLGAEGSLSPRVAEQAASAAPAGAGVVRLGGSNRYAVAARVAAEVAVVTGAPPERVFVVSGAGYADAVACAAPAAAKRWPILLADPAQPAATAAAVRATGARSAVIVGATAAVSQATQNAVATALGGASHVRRIGGADRYAVSVAVAAYAVSAAGLDYHAPVLATGAGVYDALAGGPLAARRGSPLLLVEPSYLPDAVAGVLFTRRAEVGSLTVLGGAASVPAHVRTGAQQALRVRPFSTSVAMQHVHVIAGFGPRVAGGSAERKAADYVAARLRQYGYTVRTQKVRLPGGRVSKNVIAERPGTAPGVIVIGGHMDSKRGAPGGNDNASGVAVTLELARSLAGAKGVVPTIRFVGFAAEEMSGSAPDSHHFGARQYVASLSARERARIKTMVAIDMVGYGSTFNVRTMRIAPRTTVWSLQSWGRYTGQPLPYLKDPGRFGWSDHEAFEQVGIPVAWLEWRNDPVYHTARDTASHVSYDRVRRTGRLMRGWLVGLTPTKLAALRR